MGPLSEVDSYDISVQADVYLFVDQGNGNFSAVLLGTTDVCVADGQGIAVDSVLVSLSGHGLRNNCQTNEHGHCRFRNLFPDQYYVYPLLKEYEFTPTSLNVDVNEGQGVGRHFVAVRNAYSVFGSVTSLSGDPVAGVVLHAVEESLSLLGFIGSQ